MKRLGKFGELWSSWRASMVLTEYSICYKYPMLLHNFQRARKWYLMSGSWTDWIFSWGSRTNPTITWEAPIAFKRESNGQKWARDRILYNPRNITMNSPQNRQRSIWESSTIPQHNFFQWTAFIVVGRDWKKICSAYFMLWQSKRTKELVATIGVC